MGNAIFSGLYSSQIASAGMCLDTLLMVKEQAEASREIKENFQKTSLKDTLHIYYQATKLLCLY